MAMLIAAAIGTLLFVLAWPAPRDGDGAGAGAGAGDGTGR